jgi:predicted phosphoribosyltransferase
MNLIFHDRVEAGRLLARKLDRFAHREDVLVLGLPRGGVPVAHEVAQALGAPLDVFVVRKLGVPGQRELALGAIATGGVRVLNEELIREAGISQLTIDSIAAEEQKELGRREQLYRGHRRPPVIRGKTILLVDDGIATGSTMRAALRAIRAQQPARLVIAVPTAAPSSFASLRKEADEAVALTTPAGFYAVGQFYENFDQVGDEEVTRLLARAEARPAPTTPAPA